MATTKNKFVERYVKLSGTKQVQTIEPLIEQSSSFIAKKNGIGADEVVYTLVSKILDSPKKFPLPSVDVLTSTTNKEVEQYVQFLWEYYECPTKKKPRQRQKKTANIKPPKSLPKVKPKENTQKTKPTVEIDVSSQLIKKGDNVTVTWTSTDADLVVDTTNFKIKDKKQVSGTITLKNVTKPLRLEIKVSNDVGTASDGVDVEIEDDAAADKIVDEIKRELKQKEESKKLVESKFGTSSFDKIEDKLPSKLTKDKRVYKGMNLDFELDFDLACYVLVDNKKLDNTDKPYLDWAMSVSGQDQETLIKHGKKVKKWVQTLGKEIQGLDYLYVPAVETDFTKKEDTQQDTNKRTNININPPNTGNIVINQSKKVEDLKDQTNPILTVLNDILKITKDILTNLTGEQKVIKTTNELKRRETERKRRNLRENLLEKPAAFTAKAIQKIFAPVQSIIDRIVNFLLTLLLGRALIKVLDWFKDPKNKDKVQTITRFIKDFWPALLGAYILFGTGFGKLIRSTIGLIIKATRLIVGKGIPGFVKLLKKLGPKGALAAAAIVGTGAAVFATKKLFENKGNAQEQTPQLTKKVPPSSGTKPSTTKPQIPIQQNTYQLAYPTLKATEGGLIPKNIIKKDTINNNINNAIPLEKAVESGLIPKNIIKKDTINNNVRNLIPIAKAAEGGVIPKTKVANNISNSIPIAKAVEGGAITNLMNIRDLAFASGGFISDDTGIDITGAGKDTQLVALQPGEVVISKKTVEKFGGPEFFLNLNAMGGGKNKPSYTNKVQLAATGGEVGSTTTFNPTFNNQTIASANTPNNKPTTNKPSTKLTNTFNMPAVNLAVSKLKNDEALSSLTKGKNDFIKPNSRSVVSNTPWNKLKPSTPIHAYLDSQNVPTIGWGATFYDSLFTGNKKVKMGDVITKNQADNLFKMQVLDLANNYTQKIKYWPMMSDKQRAGMLMMGFNAPNAPLGSFRQLTGSLTSGNMATAAKQIDREGPNKLRIEEERALMMSGPMDLTKAPNKLMQMQKEEEKKQQQSTTNNQNNIFQRLGDTFNNIFNPKQNTSFNSSSTTNQLTSNLFNNSSLTNNQSLAYENIKNVSNSRSLNIRPSAPASRMSFINLPTINQGQNAPMTAPGTQMTGLPDFPSISFAREERYDNATTYGIG